MKSWIIVLYLICYYNIIIKKVFIIAKTSKNYIFTLIFSKIFQKIWIMTSKLFILLMCLLNWLNFYTCYYFDPIIFEILISAFGSMILYVFFFFFFFTRELGFKSFSSHCCNYWEKKKKFFFSNTSIQQMKRSLLSTEIKISNTKCYTNYYAYPLSFEFFSSFLIYFWILQYSSLWACEFWIRIWPT